MVKKNNLFQFHYLISTYLVNVIIVVSLFWAPPGNAQERYLDDHGGLVRTGESNLAHPLHKDPQINKVRVGIYENKPKVYTSETGQPSGIFIEILKAIAKKENWKLVYVPCEWAECLKALKDRRIDLMPDVAFSQERSRIIDFNKERVLESWSQIYANKNTPVRNISDLNGRRIALLSGSIQQTSLERMMKGFGYKVSFVGAKSYEEAFSLVADGDADMVVSNNLFGDYFYKKYGLVRTAIVFNPASLYFATASGTNRDLLAAIDHELGIMKYEPGSVFYSAQAHWMERPPKTVVPRYLVWILISVAGFLVLAFVVILLLRRLVVIRTRKLVKTNDMLVESEEKFRNLFQNHSAVKLIVDPETGSIVEVNKAAENFYGCSAQQLRRKRIQDINIQPSEQGGTVLEMNKKYIQTRHRLADDSVRDVEIFGSSIDIKGKPLLHYIIHDVTEHRKLEEQYRQAQKMESVGRLAGGVAHDYNNMLGVILGYTELALMKVDLSESLHAYLEEIQNAARRSTDITRQLLAFARKQAVNPRVIDVNEIVEAMTKMLQRLIGEDIQLAWRPGKNLLPINIDPSQFEQVLVNLCVNARDAISGVGKVSIETSQVTFDEDYCTTHYGFIPGEFILLSVSDDGCGMDKETLDNIFEPFFTTKELNQGTGLGLSTVYGIAKQNNGFVNVYSEPEKGATFRIYLPCYVGNAEKITEEIIAEIPSGRNETILLVEDDSAIRKMVLLILEKLGYNVLSAGAAKEALSQAEEHPGGIQLVITDVIMPEMNGRDLADELHILYPDIKVLFMSGYTADVIAQRGMLNEDVQLIQKPFSMRGLGIKVREILDKD